MRHLRLPVVLACAVISACASTHDPGWQGADAEPFDAAQQACAAEAADVPDRNARFHACMAERGWTRPGD